LINDTVNHGVITMAHQLDDAELLVGIALIAMAFLFLVAPMAG
jgi:hypothetical protein